MTPELLILAKKLYDSLAEEWKASSTWLVYAHRILHTVLILLGVVGFVYRRELGALILSPIGLGLQLGRIGAKAAHEIHKRV